MRRNRLSTAVALAGLVLLGRCAVAYANANALWNPAFTDPAKLDLSELSGLITKTVPYSDPMDDVRRSLPLVLRPTGHVFVASPITVDEGVPRAHRPRAPPAA
jgi:hypothetical protein